MSDLVYHSIPLDESYHMRVTRSKSDVWCTFNPSLSQDLSSLLTPRTVKTFLSTLVQKLKLEVCCNDCLRLTLQVEIQVMAIVFLDRLLSNGLTLHYGNWRPVLLSVSMVACKTYDDKAVYNNDFIDCQRGLTPTLLTRLEQHLLQVLDFKVNLKVSDYLRYFFELKHLQGMQASLFVALMLLVGVASFQNPVFIQHERSRTKERIKRTSRSSECSPTREEETAAPPNPLI